MKIPEYIENVKMLEGWLMARNYDGICCDLGGGETCGCFIYDLMPCGEGFSMCMPGFKLKKNGEYKIYPVDAVKKLAQKELNKNVVLKAVE